MNEDFIVDSEAAIARKNSTDSFGEVNIKKNSKTIGPSNSLTKELGKILPRSSSSLSVKYILLF